MNLFTVYTVDGVYDDMRMYVVSIKMSSDNNFVIGITSFCPLSRKSMSEHGINVSVLE